jgi:hypothetical protein
MVLGEGCQKLHACRRKPETVHFFLRCAPEDKQTITTLLSPAAAQNCATLPRCNRFGSPQKPNNYAWQLSKADRCALQQITAYIHASTAAVLRSSSLR